MSGREDSAAATAEAYGHWQSVASGWERRRQLVWDVSRPVAETLARLLDPAPGEDVLELAAGPGDTGFLIAERLGEGGRLLSTDLVPGMVDAARRRAAELGLTNVDFRTLDGQSLDLPAASFDGVVCRWGYMLMPDAAAGLAETRRVLRPGGRVAFAVWGWADENPWGSSVGRALVERGLVEPPLPDTPGPFRLADPARIEALLEQADLALVAREDVALTWRYRDLEEFWAVSRDLSGTLSTVLRDLDEQTTAGLLADVGAALAAFRGADGYRVPGLSRAYLARPA